MRRISEWLDRHPKTRISLQLVLDGLPVLVVVLHILSFYTVGMHTDGWSGTYDVQPSLRYYAMLAGVMIFPIPAFVASFLWRDKDFELFERYCWCRWVSNGLRIVSALVVSIVFIMDIFLFAAWIST